MAKLNEHPTVKKYYADKVESKPAVENINSSGELESVWLRRICLEAGADDVGFINAESPGLENDRTDIERYFPYTKALISVGCGMNREPVRSPARSVANLEFHHTGDRVNSVASAIVSKLEEAGVKAANPSMGFPMEMSRFPGKIWTISHKNVAVAAGLGQMGIHRNVIHPKFGNFILLGTILIDYDVDSYSSPIDYNPCLECKLCVAACPVGAISSEGHFNFTSCYTHNYREIMGGFNDWVEGIAESRSDREYSQRFSDAESSSMWQSLSYGANYKAAYCMAVCPAGEDVIKPFLENRKSYLNEVLRPLQSKEETLYVIKGSDAEQHAEKRFPQKSLKRVSSGLRPSSAKGFLEGLPILFQPNKSNSIDAVIHFSFTGKEQLKGTAVIRNGSIKTFEGHRDKADLSIKADSCSWIGFIRKEKSLVWAILTGKIRLGGSIKLLKQFGDCFPS